MLRLIRYVGALYLLSFSMSASAVEIRVACAANFYPTLNAIKNQFEQSTEHKITIIRGSTGKLYAQITRGAPFDVFLSADSRRVEKLVEQGKSLDGKSYVYATGQLSLWKPESVSSQNIKEILYEGSFKKLAIANPKTAPYGAASVEALKSMELYEEVKNKLVYGENISQTLQFVESGAADLGFVSRSHVNNDIYWEVGDYMHKPINQNMIVIKHTKNPEIASQFVKYILTPEIQQLIYEHGYAAQAKGS